MPLHIHVHHHVEARCEVMRRLDALDEKLTSLKETIMSAFDDLQAAVAAEDTVIDSAITLIQGIPALIAAAGTDPAKLATLRDDITAKSSALASAVVANTPAAAAKPATP